MLKDIIIKHDVKHCYKRRSSFYLNERKRIIGSLKNDDYFSNISVKEYLSWRRLLINVKKKDSDNYKAEKVILLSNSEQKKDSDNSNALVSNSVYKAYSFVGMHHIFDVKNGITKTKFANNNNNLLAFSTSNGRIYITKIFKPRILHILKEHERIVSSFDWSSTNEYIISCSNDKKIIVWSVSTGRSIRIIDSPKYVKDIAFLPMNNNQFIIGHSNCLVIYNLSTGKQSDKFKLKNEFSCFCFSEKGDILIVGDTFGYLYVYKFINFTRFERLTYFLIRKKREAILSVSYKSWVKAKTNKPESLLLINNSSNSSYLYRLDRNDGKVTYLNKFKSENKKMTKSVFCPLLSFRKGACFAVCCEDVVKLFDVTKRKDKSNINSLMGHSAKVMDLCWNYNESLLCSGDENGIVILWKRGNG